MSVQSLKGTEDDEDFDDGCVPIMVPTNANLRKKMENARLRDLVDTDGFEFDTKEELPDGNWKNSVISDSYKYINNQLDGQNSQNGNKQEEENVEPFQLLSRNATNITADGLVKKVILQHGSAAVVPCPSYVTVHYNAYVEYQDEPYDSSRLRENPWDFLLGAGEVIEGMDLGVRTMKKGEIARFILSPQYAYGSQGCPPRIPPNAYIMFEIELLNFVETSKEIVEFYSLSAEDRQEQPMMTIGRIVELERKEGKMKYDRKDFRQAVRHYQRALKTLETCTIRDDDDERLQTQLLTRLYTNIATCYIMMKKFKLSITYSNRAIGRDKEYAKAYYLKAKARRLIDDIDGAEKSLNDAERCDIDTELKLKLKNERKLIDENRRFTKQIQKNLYSRMFQGYRKQDEGQPDQQCPDVKQEQKQQNSAVVLNEIQPSQEMDNCTDVFKNEITAFIQEFLDSSCHAIDVPSTEPTEKEIAFIELQAKEMNVDLRTEMINDKHYKLTLVKKDV